MPGIKHLIECHCYLAIFKSDTKVPPVHKFPVYSKINDLGNVIEKMVKCNNCDSFHKITEIGKSEFIPGKDQANTIVTKKDLRAFLPENITNVLDAYDCDISSWEHAEDILSENRWGEEIVISREIIGEKTNVKILKINEKNSFKILNETINETIIS